MFPFSLIIIILNVHIWDWNVVNINNSNNFLSLKYKTCCSTELNNIGVEI